MKPSRTTKTAHSGKSNLIQLLKALSKEEIKEFDKFIRSPFFNNRNEVTGYFLLIKKYYPEFNHTELIKKKIFKKLYPGKAYRDDIMRRLNSNLFKLGEDYLTLCSFNRYKFPFGTLLLSSLSEHGLDELFMKAYTNVVSELNTEKINNETFGIKRFYENIYIGHNMYMNRELNIVSNVLDNGVYNILNFFAHLPHNYSNIIINKKKYNYEPKQNLTEKFISNFNFKEFLNGLDNSQNEYIKALPLYIYELLLYQFPENDEYYFQYKSAILKHKNVLSDNELSSHLVTLHNYCNDKMMQGKEKYINEAYEIIRLRLKENSLIYHEHILVIEFWNVVSVGLQAKKADFVEKFIREYGDSLLPDVRKDTLNLCRARVLFERRQFEKALEAVNKIKIVHKHLQKAFKHFLLKIYYELGFVELLFSHIDTYRHYATNNKTISEETKKRIGKFLNYVHTLTKLKIEPNLGELYALKKSLHDKNNAMSNDRNWLLEKAAELEKVSLKN